MSRALLALGANLGDPRASFAAAIASLTADPRIREQARSHWRETSPVGGPPNQPRYVNGALLVETELSPSELWERMSQAEAEAGRERREHWDARTLDLDLLLYDDDVLNDARLVVPHPRLALRRFVLEPAAEIAPEMVHPRLGRTLGELYAHVLNTPRLAAIALEDRRAAEALLEKALQRRIAEPCEGAVPRDVDVWRMTRDWSAEDEHSGAAAPRFLIAQPGDEERLKRLAWPGPIAFVPVGELDRAVDEIAIAIQGLT